MYHCTVIKNHTIRVSSNPTLEISYRTVPKVKVRIYVRYIPQVNCKIRQKQEGSKEDECRKSQHITHKHIHLRPCFSGNGTVNGLPHRKGKTVNCLFLKNNNQRQASSVQS